MLCPSPREQSLRGLPGWSFLELCLTSPRGVPHLFPEAGERLLDGPLGPSPLNWLVPLESRKACGHHEKQLGIQAPLRSS